MKTYKVGYFVGSLAKGSINRQLAQALTRLAPPGLELTEISIRDLPLPEGAERTVLLGDAAAEVPKVIAAAKDLIENLNTLTGDGGAARG